MSIEGRKDNRSFNIPDLTNRVPMHSWDTGIGHQDDGSLPKITGSIWPYSSMGGDVYGAFSWVAGNNTATRGSGAGRAYDFDAYRCSGAYKRTDNHVLPRSLNMYYIIKI